MLFSRLTALACAGFFAFSTQAMAQDPPKVLPPDAAKTCALQAGEFENDWLKLTFPDGPETRGNPLRGNTIGPFFDIDSGLVYVFPFDGPHFEAGKYGLPDNCEGYQWGAQMFYWLTSTIQDGKEGVQNPAPQPTTGDTRWVFASEWFYHMVESDDGPVLLGQGGVRSQSEAFRIRTDKADSVGQAGETKGVLFTQASGDVSQDSSIVYYSVHANRNYGYIRDAVLKDSWVFTFDGFPDTAQKACEGLYYGLLNGFINLENEFAPLTLAMIDVYCPLELVQDIAVKIEKELLSELEKIEEKYPIIKSILHELGLDKGLNPDMLGAIENVIPFVEPAVDYLSMTTEVKASWVRADSLQNPGDYIRHMGQIPIYSDPDGDGDMQQTGTETVELALIGMHIVGTVAGHPEMIWATIEHRDNAPSLPYSYVDENGQTKTWNDVAEVPGKAWLLSDGTDANPNLESALFHPAGSAREGGGTYETDTIAPAKAGQSDPTTSPTNALRLNPWGSPADAASAEANSELISVNASVWETFSEYYKNTTVQDPRMNYIVTGVSWGADGQIPTGTDPSEIDGTAAMSNMSMETFEQGTRAQPATTGCFTCHGIPRDAPSSFGLSHIFSSIVGVEK